MSARAQAARGYRMRPAPRRRGRDGGLGSRIRWDRLGRIVLVLVIGLVLISYVNPVVNFIDAWTGKRAEYAQLGELREENAKLRQRLATLDSPDAAERAARKLGMVEPGEASYVIEGLNR